MVLSFKEIQVFTIIFFFRQIKKSHVGVLRWHRPREEDKRSWEKQLNRLNFNITKSTVVCSNHFAAGYYNSECKVPTLYMKGYNNDSDSKRKAPLQRETLQATKKMKPSRNIIRHGDDHILPKIPIIPPPYDDHAYEIPNAKESCSRCYPRTICISCCEKSKTIQTLLETIKKQEHEIDSLKKEEKRHFSITEIKESDKLMLFYTGLQSYAVFKWLYERLKDKIPGITYTSYKKESSGKKRGPKRQLSGEEEMFMTLVRLRLGLLEDDLAYRFGMSQSSISTITSTWCSFLAKEWCIFIHWPTQEENKRYFPNCFSAWPNTIAILDCTEGGIEKPSIAKAQAQTYSSYKSKNTWKKLISITPGGLVSYISKAYGGSASDRHIVENCGILSNVKAEDQVMVDKGFNIGDLLVGRQSELVHPPFLNDKGKFSATNIRKTSDIAKARIHVERAIARIKDFRIIQGNIPLTIKDQIDDIFIIIAAINNIGPCLVPL